MQLANLPIQGVKFSARLAVSGRCDTPLVFPLRHAGGRPARSRSDAIPLLPACQSAPSDCGKAPGHRTYGRRSQCGDNSRSRLADLHRPCRGPFCHRTRSHTGGRRPGPGATSPAGDARRACAGLEQRQWPLMRRWLPVGVRYLIGCRRRFTTAGNPRIPRSGRRTYPV